VLARRDPASTRSMAEFVLMQVLLHHRRVGVSLLDRPARRWEPVTRGPLAGCRIAVLGFGPMAQASAELLADFGCALSAWSRSPRAHKKIALRAGWDSFDAMFLEAEILVNLLPSTPETRGVIDARRLALLPRGAGFINVGRGDAVDQGALLSALDRGALALASLDVLPLEPPPTEDPVWTHPRVILTPHLASLPLPGDFARWVVRELGLGAGARHAAVPCPSS
jgi:glyoxylate/hydroxypyruvate reductase A